MQIALAAYCFNYYLLTILVICAGPNYFLNVFLGFECFLARHSLRVLWRLTKIEDRMSTGKVICLEDYPRKILPLAEL